MNVLLSAFGDWLGKNWIILVLIVLAIALLVPTYLRQKKEVNARNELNDSIKKGTKIITTAGVYGVVESIRETTDGKVVTIVTGNAKNPTTMDIHINAIGGIDNKSAVTADMESKVVEDKVNSKEKNEVETNKEEKNEVETTTITATITANKTSKPKSSAKKTTKKSTKNN